ncbi:MAG: type II toxin-antitoxin system VapC family toxin [Nitrosomonadales bacterium]|nr:type II toxin-antitoxin system VapC family toxin [Nitrosomonadales bacterium]
MPVKAVFLDTGFAIALASPRDRYHARAVQLADELKTSGYAIITTRAVLLEIGAALAKVSYRGTAISIIEMLENDPDVEIVPLQDELFAEAFELFRGRLDKEWSLTDCMSFVAMRQRGIQAALAADIHFQQAGFEALLLET